MGAKDMEGSKKKAESFSEKLVRRELKLRDKGVDGIWCTLLIFLDIAAGLWGCHQIAYELVEEMPWGAPGLLVDKHVAVFLIIGRFGGRIVTVNSGIILLTGCSYLLTWLRSTRLARFLPLDNLMPHWHLRLAVLTGAAAALHTIAITCLYASTALNWSTGVWSVSAQSVQVTQELVTGILLVVILASMLTLPWQRRKHFKLFWVHHLVGMALYVVITILHGCFYGRPITWAFLALPMMLYAADRCLRVLKATAVIDGVATIRALDGDIICLEFPRPFDFHPGMYARICVPQLSPYEFHPFTIASSPMEDTARFYIKALGDWTRALLALAKPVPAEPMGLATEGGGARGNTAPVASTALPHPQTPPQVPPGDPNPTSSPPPVSVTVKVTGPFGAPAQHFSQFAKVVLVSTGIGVTPMSAIIRDLFFRRMRLYRELGEGLLRRMPVGSMVTQAVANHLPAKGEPQAVPAPVSGLPAAGTTYAMTSSYSGSATPPTHVSAPMHPLDAGSLDAISTASTVPTGPGSHNAMTGTPNALNPTLQGGTLPAHQDGTLAAQSSNSLPVVGGHLGGTSQGRDPATQADPASHVSIDLAPRSTSAASVQDAGSQHGSEALQNTVIGKESVLTAAVASLGRRPTLTRLTTGLGVDVARESANVTRQSPGLTLSHLDAEEACQVAAEAVAAMDRQARGQEEEGGRAGSASAATWRSGTGRQGVLGGQHGDVPDAIDSVDVVAKMLGGGGEVQARGDVVARASSQDSTGVGYYGRGVHAEVPKSAASSTASVQIGWGEKGRFSRTSRWREWGSSIMQGWQPWWPCARSARGDDVEKKSKRKGGETHTNPQHAMEYRLLNRLAEFEPAVAETRWKRVQLWAAKIMILLQLGWVSLSWMYVSLFASFLLAAGIIGFAFIAHLWSFSGRVYQIAAISLVAINAPGLLANLVMTVITMREEMRAENNVNQHDGRGESLLRSLVSGRMYVGRLRFLLVVLSTLFLLGSLGIIGAALGGAVFDTPSGPPRCPWSLPQASPNRTTAIPCGVWENDADSIASILSLEAECVGRRPCWERNYRGYFGRGAGVGNWSGPGYSGGNGGQGGPGGPGGRGRPRAPASPTGPPYLGNSPAGMPHLGENGPGTPVGGPQAGGRRLTQQAYGPYDSFNDFCVGTKGEVEVEPESGQVWCDYGGLIQDKRVRGIYHVAWIVWIVLFCAIEVLTIALSVRRVFSTTTLQTREVDLAHLHTRTLTMIWVGQDLTGFHWFFDSLRDLVHDCSLDGAMSDFLRCKIFLTRIKKDEQAALRASGELLPFIEVHFARPDWDQVISDELVAGCQRYKRIASMSSSSSSTLRHAYSLSVGAASAPAHPPVRAATSWHNYLTLSRSDLRLSGSSLMVCPLADTPPVNAEDVVIIFDPTAAPAAPTVRVDVVPHEPRDQSLPATTGTEESGEDGPASFTRRLPQRSASTSINHNKPPPGSMRRVLTRSNSIADQPLVPAEAGFGTVGIFFCGSHVVSQAIADACLTAAQRQVTGTKGDMEQGGTSAREWPVLPEHIVFRKENF
eukprot:jgi/Mesvir1/5126/Mv25537-RA.1